MAGDETAKEQNDDGVGKGCHECAVVEQFALVHASTKNVNVVGGGKQQRPMSDTDVAQGEMASVTHNIVANANTAMMRCWITLRPSIPKHDTGKFHITSVTNRAKAKSAAFLMLKSPLRVNLFSVPPFFCF